jgi:hypothetical protein
VKTVAPEARHDLPPIVFVLGPTAAGKTTALAAILAVLKEAGWDGAFISIEDCQRAVCPPGSENGSYFYDKTGALVLLERESNAAAARDCFVHRCSAASRRGFVAELGQPQAPQFLLQRLPELLSGTLVLHITAPLAERRLRNERKAALRMPEAVLTWIEEALPAEMSAALTKAGAAVFQIESSAPLPQYLATVQSFARRWYANRRQSE